MVGGIQGNLVDTTIALLKFHGVELQLNGLTIISQVPTVSALWHFLFPSFTFDLKTIKPNWGAPRKSWWHPLSKKSHDFQSSFFLIGSKWEIDQKWFTLSYEKCLAPHVKLATLLSVPHLPCQQEDHGLNICSSNM